MPCVQNKTALLIEIKENHKSSEAENTEAQKKARNSKLFHAVWIGFLAGILLFGIVAWSMMPEKKIGFLIPFFFPAFFMYKLLKKPPQKGDSA